MSRPLPPILLVEDDDNDVFLMRRAFTAAQVEHPVFVARNGEHAIELLTKVPNMPCLIITDMKMPELDGLRLLLWFRTQPAFRDLPKLVISSLALEEGLARFLLLGATAYFTKPNNLDDLVEMVRKWKTTYLEGSFRTRKQ